MSTILSAEPPDMTGFNEYVFKYGGEMIHSGIGANVAYLSDPQETSVDKMTRALLALEQYASESITAYRAIEWWASLSGFVPLAWVTQDGKSTLPIDIFARIIKPTHYCRMSIEKVKITE